MASAPRGLGSACALALALAACQGTPPATGPRPSAAPQAGPSTWPTSGPSVGQASPLAQASVPFVGRPESSRAPSPAPSQGPEASPSPAPSPLATPSALASAPSPSPSGFATTELAPPAVLARVVAHQEPGPMGLQPARSLLLVSNTESPPGGTYGPLGGGAGRRLLAAPQGRRLPCGVGGAVAQPKLLRPLLQAVSDGGTLSFSVGPGFGVPTRTVSARAVASGGKIVVLLDVAEEANPARQAALVAKARRIVEAFDGAIHARDVALFGPGPGTLAAGDARLHLVLSGAVDDNGRAPIPAYFSPGDQGQRAVIHMATSQVDRAEADFLGTVAHEYQHLINHHHKVRLGGAGDLEDLWIDEGLAMLAMQANGYGFGSGAELFQYQAVQFLNEPGAFSLSDWGANPEGRGYGAGYFFFQYLSGRFGEGLIKAIVTAPQRGVANLDARLREQGSSFPQAFTDFATACLVADRAPGLPSAWSFPGFRFGQAIAPPELPRFAIEPPNALPRPLRPLQFRLMALPLSGPVALQPSGLAQAPALSL